MPIFGLPVADTQDTNLVALVLVKVLQCSKAGAQGIKHALILFQRDLGHSSGGTEICVCITAEECWGSNTHQSNSQPLHGTAGRSPVTAGSCWGRAGSAAQAWGCQNHQPQAEAEALSAPSSTWELLSFSAQFSKKHRNSRECLRGRAGWAQRAV